MKVLVSVKDKEEAVEAVDGGADIIDLKNPFEGSLGACFPWIIKEVVEVLPKEVEISLAIGDLPYLPGTASLAAFGGASMGVNYIKAGLHGVKRVDEAVYLMSKVVDAVRLVGGKVKVVAVGYADASRIGAVNPLKVPEIAFKSGADVAMVDTAIKDGNCLFKYLSNKALKHFIDQSHKMGLLVALAGSLKRIDLSQVKKLKPDVVGFRGLACEKGDRFKGRVTKELVKEIINKLKG